MKAYIRYDKTGIPKGLEEFSAQKGFENYGVETVPFTDIKTLKGIDPEDVVVTGIGETLDHLSQYGITPLDLDYPEELHPYLHRNIRRTTLDKVLYLEDSNYPIFVKPVRGKAFRATVFDGPCPYLECYQHIEADEPVWFGSVVDWISEYRVFVVDGRIVDIRRYWGSWKYQPDLNEVQHMVNAFTSAPSAYGLDVGVIQETACPVTALVEVNDGFSLGAYGLSDRVYAALLGTRWAELTGTFNEFKFALSDI